MNIFLFNVICIVYVGPNKLLNEVISNNAASVLLQVYLWAK
jgi:hypothetical protein